MANTVELSIIVVNWNSADFLVRCVASIEQNTEAITYEVIVVDNASNKDDIDKIEQHLPGVAVIQNSGNVGFARGNNVGFEHSIGRYVLFLNPDTELIGPTINIMLSAIKKLPNAGIVGCKLLNTDRSIQLSSIGKFPTILNQALDMEYLLSRWPRCPLWGIGPLFLNCVEPIPVDVISGACMLLRREVFAQVGMFSEEYFMYGEDIDLNYRVLHASFVNYYVGQAVMIHHGGKSSSRQSGSQWKTTMKFGAMLRYCRNSRGVFYGFLYRGTMCAAATVRLALLTAAYPLGGLLWNRETIQQAIDKWMTILKCTIGRRESVVRGL